MAATGNIRSMGPLQLRFLRAQVKSSIRFQFHNNVQPFRLVCAIRRWRELDTTELLFHAGVAVSGRDPDLVINISQSCRAGRHVSWQLGFLQLHGCTSKLCKPQKCATEGPTDEATDWHPLSLHPDRIAERGKWVGTSRDGDNLNGQHFQFSRVTCLFGLR